jgi:hypothetical protein
MHCKKNTKQTHQNILLNVSTLHGCHHQEAIIVVKIVLPAWYRGWTIADHLVKIAVPPVTTYMELKELSPLLF